MGQRGSVQGLACHLGLLPQNYVVIMPELIAALAATVAAILSGVALWLGGAREKHKWLRDELVDTVVQFLDASLPAPAMRSCISGANQGLLLKIMRRPLGFTDLPLRH